MSDHVDRTGRYIRQPAGYRAFIPNPLPPDPPLDYSSLALVLAEASEAAGRLDGLAALLPDPERFISMYVRREAELSSRIEGTESTLDDILEYEAEPASQRLPSDIGEVFNYVRALNHGIQRLDTLPLSNRLIREMHAILMEGVRGQERQPGEFRTSQNWIGRPGATLAEASFVPPPAPEVPQAMGDLERFMHEPRDIPPLVHAGLVHAQFEIIHPFLDGNGRAGRLLITLLLHHHGVLRQPLLYLSSHLQLHRMEYYARLTAIRERGDWEGWLGFFLRGVAATAAQSINVSRRVVELQEHHRQLVSEQSIRSGLAVLDQLYSTPVVSINALVERLELPYSTTNSLVRRFEQLGILTEITGRQRDRLYRFDAYVDIFRRG